MTERQNPGSGGWPGPEEREKGMVCWSADLKTSTKVDADGIITDYKQNDPTSLLAESSQKTMKWV